MSRPLVLYAEDEPDDAFFMRLAIRRVAPELELRIAEHGRAAIEYLEGCLRTDGAPANRVPNVVLLDLNMPLLTGFEVLRWLRAQAALSHVPVIMFSSSGRQDDRRLAVAAGANTYLIKPSSGDQFDAVAQELVRWTHPAPVAMDTKP